MDLNDSYFGPKEIVEATLILPLPRKILCLPLYLQVVSSDFLLVACVLC